MATSKSFKNIQLEELNNLIKNIPLFKKYHVKVGIIDDTTRDDGKTNAQVGNFAEKMEFGSRSENVPRRSFLVDPLKQWKSHELEEYLRKSTGIMKDLTVVEKGVKRVYNRLGSRAKDIVQDAFYTGGFGNWKPLSKLTIKKKGNDRILVDTGQLRDSIQFRTDKGK